MAQKSASKQKVKLSPFAWPGSKRQLAPFLVGMFPEHKHYVEVFGGSLSLLWNKPKSKLETVNDIDMELVDLYMAIQKHPCALSERIRLMPHSRELFKRIMSGNKIWANDSLVSRGAIAYYRLQASFGSKRLHFGRGISGHTPAARLVRDFTVWSIRLQGVQVECLSFEKLIPTFDTAETFFYLDPPYMGSEDVYVSSDKKFAHEGLCELLKGTKAKWMLSYNDHPKVRELYKDFKVMETPKIAYSLAGGDKCKQVSEIVVVNY